MNAEVGQYLDSLSGQVAAGTIEQRRLCLKRFTGFLQTKKIAYEELESNHLAQFAHHLQAQVRNQKQNPIGQARIQRHLHNAGLFLRFLYRRKKILRDLSLQIKVVSHPPKLPFVPSYSQVLRLLELTNLNTLIGLRDRAMFETVYGCGLRLLELHQMELCDLDLEAGTLSVPRGKGGRSRFLPLGRWACHYLERYLRQARPQLLKGGPYNRLWLSLRGQPLADEVAIQNRFELYQKKLDYPLSCHTLRHAFATHLLEGGANLRQVQQLLGHVNLRITERYTRVRPVKLKEVHRNTHPRG